MSSLRPQMPSGFLSLAPATSSSYPQPKQVSPPVTPAATTATTTTVPLTAAVLDAATTAATTTTTSAPAMATALKERTSSLSSNGSSSGAGLRVLKLAPVHWGEHLDGAKGDWHDDAVVE